MVRKSSYLYLKELPHLKQDVLGVAVLFFTVDSCLEKKKGTKSVLKLYYFTSIFMQHEVDTLTIYIAAATGR